MDKHLSSIRIVIADDHPIFRDGLRRLLESEGDMKVVARPAMAARRLSWPPRSNPTSFCSISPCRTTLASMQSET